MLAPDGSYRLGDHFDCSEELGKPEYLGGKTSDEIRGSLSLDKGWYIFQGSAGSDQHDHLRPPGQAASRAGDA